MGDDVTTFRPSGWWCNNIAAFHSVLKSWYLNGQ